MISVKTKMLSLSIFKDNNIIEMHNRKNVFLIANKDCSPLSPFPNVSFRSRHDSGGASVSCGGVHGSQTVPPGFGGHRILSWVQLFC